MKVGLLLLCILSSHSGYAQTTVDPIQDYRRLLRHDKISSPILILRTDIDHDGFDDVLLASKENVVDDENDGIHPIVYLGTPSGYVRSGYAYRWDGSPDIRHGITINRDKYYVGFIPELNRYGLLTMFNEEDRGTFTTKVTAIVVEKRNAYREINIPVDQKTLPEIMTRFSNTDSPRFQITRNNKFGSDLRK